MRLCAASRPVSSLPDQQQHFAGLPRGGFGAGHGVEIHAARAGDVVGQLRPVVERGRIEKDRAGAVEHDVRVARGGAVGNHGDGQVGGVGRGVEHLHVEHGGQAAESLRADAEAVDLVVELDAQLFGRGFRDRGRSGPECRSGP